MRKIKYTVLICAALLTSASFASWQQDVTLCLNVNSTSDILFWAGVTSTDVFDNWHYARRVNGQTCVKHSYDHGPKNFKLRVKADTRDLHFAIIYPDSSCSYLNKVDHRWYESGALGTGRHNEYWTLTLTQREVKEGDKFTFNLSCQHWAN